MAPLGTGITRSLQFLGLARPFSRAPRGPHFGVPHPLCGGSSDPLRVPPSVPWGKRGEMAWDTSMCDAWAEVVPIFRAHARLDVDEPRVGRARVSQASEGDVFIHALNLSVADFRGGLKFL